MPDEESVVSIRLSELVGCQIMILVLRFWMFLGRRRSNVRLIFASSCLPLQSPHPLFRLFPIVSSFILQVGKRQRGVPVGFAEISISAREGERDGKTNLKLASLSSKGRGLSAFIKHCDRKLGE